MSERTATPRRTSGGEPSKRSLTERLQDTLSSAAEEHRANAGPAESRGSRVRRAAGRQPRRARLERALDRHHRVVGAARRVEGDGAGGRRAPLVVADVTARVDR